MVETTVGIFYSDLFLLTLIPIILQGVAIGYLWKIHKFIGKEMTLLLGIINGILLAYDIVISYLLFATGNIPRQQVIEVWGLFIGFGMPVGNAVAHLILQMRMAKVFDFGRSIGGGGR